MKEIKIIASKYDVYNLENFIAKYHSQKMYYKDNQWYFRDHLDKEFEEIEFSIKILDFENISEDQFFDYMKTNVFIAYETARKLTYSEGYEDDFAIFDKNFDVVRKIEMSMLKYQYMENWSIIDYFADLFLEVLKSHLFKNGNKRFALAFLKALMNSAGFYINWSRRDYNYYLDRIQNSMAEEIVCLAICLSNRSFEDSSFLLKEQKENNSRKNSAESCVNKLRKYQTSDLSNRHEKIRIEVVKWIKNLTTISY
ncbi:type II toxin-antitoxin system death-on-curing family toxin [Mycoplasma phocoeninasale]|uniref:Type II toxin-antitoxin system death-on-curing family toxin n=1 Tax=Mycoplasma phocoeninasale TaxID=2726117 RepID=A0A858U6T5_9MOLU|nr:type II toxin-antitoxin system death-on-curing family toxin [Mycoplasma phocoeninasale]QJG66498.1 type II toxin-antitoxin system death-on-curing family toxin [Mycoplasma phocoeninasale]